MGRIRRLPYKFALWAQVPDYTMHYFGLIDKVK